MKLIFVCGLPDIDKASLVDLALQRSGVKGSFALVDFDRIQDIHSDMESAQDLDLAKKTLSGFYARIERAMIAKLKERKGDIVVSGCLAVATRHGYLRMVPDDFFRSFKPDSIVILEKDEPAGKDAATSEHQRINRYYGAFCSSVAGSALKIIKFNEKKMVDAVGELGEVFRR